MAARRKTAQARDEEEEREQLLHQIWMSLGGRADGTGTVLLDASSIPASSAAAAAPQRPPVAPKPPKLSVAPKLPALHRQDPPPVQQPRQPSPSAPSGAGFLPAGRHTYIFVDNSNLVHGARNMADGSRDNAVIVNIDRLVPILEGGMPCAERVLVGSNISEALKSRWEQKRFRILKSDRQPGQGEKFVDEALHSCISHHINHRNLVHCPQTMVLVTGDGNEHENTTSFPDLVHAAARNGWYVIVWAWRLVLSDRFEEVRSEFPDLVQIRLLDDHRDTITFRASPKTEKRPSQQQQRSPSPPQPAMPSRAAGYSAPSSGPAVSSYAAPRFRAGEAEGAAHRASHASSYASSSHPPPPSSHQPSRSASFHASSSRPSSSHGAPPRSASSSSRPTSTPSSRAAPRTTSDLDEISRLLRVL